MNKKAHKAKLEQAIRHVHVSVSRRGDERTITNDHERSRRVAPCLSIVRISLDLVSHWGAGVGDGKRTRHLEILNDIEALLLQDTPPFDCIPATARFLGDHHGVAVWHWVIRRPKRTPKWMGRSGKLRATLWGSV